MNNAIIIILGIILLVLIILNHITFVVKPSKTEKQGNCAETTFGCCPDGINSKINFYGTNCPAYRPGPGYYPNAPLTPQPGQNGKPQSSYLTPGPGPNPPKPIGGCAGSRYGCCANNQTPKMDALGSNCPLHS